MKIVNFAVVTLLAAAAYAPAATVEELKATYKAGDFAAVISDVDKQLTDSNANLADGDAFMLMILKAESLMQQGSRPSAAREFASAARMAPDIKQVAWARASGVILQRTNGNSYKPKSGGEAIDLVNVDSRRKAFAALLVDMRADVQRRQRDALRAKALPQLEDAVLPVADACFVEIAATGEAKEMEPLLKEISVHAQNLIAADITRLQRQVSHLDRLAGSWDEYGGGGGRGITSREREDLRDLQRYIERVETRIRGYRDAAIRMGRDGRVWDELLLKADALMSDAGLLLDTRW